MKTIALVGLALGSVALGACGGSISVEDYVNEQIKAECDFQVRCCASVANATMYASTQDCIAANQTATSEEIASVQAAIKAKTVTYDGSAASNCLGEFDSVLKKCGASFSETKAESSCKDVIKGNIGSGGSCDANDDECKDGFECSNGTCTALAAVGSSCANADCVDNAYCDDNNTCQALKASGATCEDDSECQSASCPNGTCTDSDQTLPNTDVCLTT